MDLLALPCVVQAGENAGSNASQYEAEVLFMTFLLVTLAVICTSSGLPF